MKCFVKIKSVLAVMIISISACFGQQVVATSGGQFSDANYDLSWTIGELLTTTLKGDNIIVTQGFNQSKLLVSEVNVKEQMQNLYSVYPNPVESELTLNSGYEDSRLTIVLTNMTGENILNEKINGGFSQHTLKFSSYREGVYFLHIFNQDDHLVQTFKIIKL